MTELTFHHLGVAVPDLQQSRTTYEQLFGYELRGGPYDDPIQQATVCFLGSDRAGQPLIEAIAPLGNDSHVHRLLGRGAGAYHTCYETDDLDQTLAHAKTIGCIIVRTPAPAVAFDGRRIAWFYTPDRHLVEGLER